MSGSIGVGEVFGGSLRDWIEYEIEVKIFLRIFFLSEIFYFSLYVMLGEDWLF